MPASFSLRIESGAQAGETAILEGGGLSVGRRPGNDLVLQDPSVSGRHARLSIESDRLVVVDFGSTNGTFVDGAKVEEASLDPGCALRFGKVELSVHAGAVEASAAPAAPAAMPAATPPPRPAPEPAEPVLEEPGDDLELELEDPADDPVGAGLIDDDLDDELHEIDLARLGRAKKGPGALPLVAGLVVVGGAAAWYLMGMPGLGNGDDGAGPAREVPKVAGNLLGDPSFEAGDLGTAAWSVDETAPVSPWTSDAWRDGGELGAGCDLEADEWALVRSAPVRLTTARGLEAGAVAWAEGSGRVTLGVQLIDDDGEHPDLTAWTAAVGEDGPGQLELALGAPPGYERARLLLSATSEGGPGAGAFDDAFLVPKAVPALAELSGFTVHDIGAGRVALAHIDRPLVVGMGRASGVIGAARAEGDGFALDLGGSGALDLVLDPGFFAQGLATLGEDGYQPHGDGFEDQGVTSIVVGEGVHQLRFALPAATTVSGQPLAAGFRLTVASPGGALTVEQDFAEERAHAGRLNDKARMAEREGDLAAALGFWGELLDEVPFDQDLVLAAEASRARLVAAGLAELDALRGDFERARFFGLPGLFEQCLAGIDDVGRRYAGSEVADVAAALGGELAGQAAEILGVETDELAGARAAVLELIEAEGSDELAAHLRAASKETD